MGNSACTTTIGFRPTNNLLEEGAPEAYNLPDRWLYSSGNTKQESKGTVEFGVVLL